MPKVFVSYSHDSIQHKAWVLRLATDLVEQGVDVTLDQWDLSLGMDVARFMSEGIRQSEYVLLICSASYVQKAQAATGGVGFEQQIVTGELVSKLDTTKFIPLVRANLGDPKIPGFLGARMYVDFNDDSSYAEKREVLLRELHGAPANVKPPIGANPFADTRIRSIRTKTDGNDAQHATPVNDFLANSARAMFLFRQKSTMLDQNIAIQESNLRRLRKGTKKWSDANMGLESLQAEKIRLAQALERLQEARRRASGSDVG